MAQSKPQTWTAQNSILARAASLAKRKSEPRIHPKRQAVHIQHALYNAVDLLDSDLSGCETDETRARVATAIASVAKGWQSMTEMLRVMSGKPNPGTLSPSERANAKSKLKSPQRTVPRPVPVPAEESSKESLS